MTTLTLTQTATGAVQDAPSVQELVTGTLPQGGEPMIHFFRFNKAAANEIYAGSSGSAAEERRIREIRGANNKGRRVGDDGRRIMVAEVMYGIAAATAALFLLVTTL